MLTEQQIRKIVRDELVKCGVDVNEPVVEEKEVTGIRPYPHNDTPTRWPDSEYWEYIGKPQCRYMGKDFMALTAKIIKETHNGVPLVLADSCARRGNCPGHNKLHSSYSMRTFDGLYPSKMKLDKPITGIYSNYSKHVIDPDIFDWERFHKLMLAIHRHSLKPLKMCGDAVWQFVYEKLKRNKGDHMEWFKLGIQHTDAWNHPTHFHITFASRIFWEERE